MFVQNVARIPYVATIAFFPNGGNKPMTVDKLVYAASAEDAKLRARDILNEEYHGREPEIIAVSVVKKEVPGE